MRPVQAYRLALPGGTDSISTKRRSTASADAGIDVALGATPLRLSPHVYNTFEQIDHAAKRLVGAISGVR